MTRLLLIPLTSLLALQAEPAPAPSVHRMNVEIRGPVAMLEVQRSISLEGSPDEERVLDLALPAGAAVVGWEVDGVSLAAAPEGQARADHARALAARGATATRVALEEGTDLRLHLAAGITISLVRVR
jgi:hypothetical protein